MDSAVNENYTVEKEKLPEEEFAAADVVYENPEYDDSTVKFLNDSKVDTDDVKIKIPKKDKEPFTGLGKDELMKYANDRFWVRIRIALFALFWIGWLAMLVAAILIIVLAPRCPYRPDHKWWNKDIIYQVYPKSFKDSNGNGVGDIKGIQDKADYFTNVSKILWLNPIYESPLLDSGYDVTNHMKINSEFGSHDEFVAFVKTMKKSGVKILLDFVPNHTSRNHTWFIQSRKKEGKYTDYYMWADCSGRDDGKPNNWKSIHGGSAWTYDKERKQCYLHQFLDSEPDLNLRNEDVQKELKEILHFWMKTGIDGFHIAHAAYLMEGNVTANEPGNGKNDANDYNRLDHTETLHQMASLSLIQDWREIIDSYSKPGREKLLFTTVSGNVNITLPYLGDGDRRGVHFVPSQALYDATNACGATCLYEMVNSVLSDLPENVWGGWRIGDENTKRLASRVDGKNIGGILTLQMLLPGTAVNYYGDEIALKDEPLMFDEAKDPLAIKAGKDTYTSIYRDPYRTPMRWNSAANAGFTNGTSWLPIKNLDQSNVLSQMAVYTEDQTLTFFSKLWQLRQNPSFRWGKLTFSVHTENILSFIRQAEGFPAFLVAMNFGKEPATSVFYGEAGTEIGDAATVFNTQKGHDREVKLSKRGVMLQPGEVVVFKLE